MVWVRIDVDHCCYNKYLSYLRLMTGVRVPDYLNHVYELQTFLHPYNIHRVWFFRPLTAPIKPWKESFGLHLVKPWNIIEEKAQLENITGELISSYTRHGGARFQSGETIPRWVNDKISQKALMIDLTNCEYLTIGRPHYYPKLKDTEALDRIECILIHPIHFRQYQEHLKFWVELFIKRDQKFREQAQAREIKIGGFNALRDHNTSV